MEYTRSARVVKKTIVEKTGKRRKEKVEGKNWRRRKLDTDCHC